ncbi:hypothetical protein HNR46_001307 [Haloferula luteola]|uniref:Uncharacterized protein n=1 Tax=Haloferula luteola TaxID=595692 RepID=A0A840V128_9BACT|nr:hypothetical protein [Haloferula luteola]MBB5351073.1 hypothetical protein [Haloferula luteola]
MANDTETPIGIIPAPVTATPGIKTTEFWLVLALNLIAVALAALDAVDAKWALGVSAVLNTIYGMGRSWVKAAVAKSNGVPFLLLMAVACLALASCTITLDPSGNWSAQPDPASVTIIAEKAIEATK